MSDPAPPPAEEPAPADPSPPPAEPLEPSPAPAEAGSPLDPTPGGAAGFTPEAIERHRRAIRQEKALTWTLRGLALLLLVIIVGFLLGGFLRIRTLWTVENFEGPAQEELTRLTPIMGDHMLKAIANTRPALTELTMERWDRVRPKLAEALDKEFDVFRENLTKRMENDLHEMIEEVVGGKEDALKRELPQFTDEAKREEFRRELTDKFIDTCTRVADQAYAANRETIDGMLVSIEEFEQDNPYERMDDDQLNRQYISLWLRLVDYHVLYEPITED